MVLVLDTNRQPCDPVHPGAARRLLTEGKAAVFRRAPFTIILKAARCDEPQPLRLKLDPGSKTTGIAVIDDASGQVVFAAELQHRGLAIRKRLQDRAMVRRSRRQRKTRYRKPRFLNRRRKAGWLAPSLQHRVETVMTWVNRLRARLHITAISVELVRFDTQLLEQPEISGVEYQQGTLAGDEVREYVLERSGRHCAYCTTTHVPLELDHVIPRTRGGSNRPSNLVPACRPCNQRKGNQTAAEFGFPDVERSCKQPLKDAAAVNSTRWALYERLQATGLPVEVGTGGRTKYNRTVRGVPKAHWLDAACVGASTPVQLRTTGTVPLQVTAMGHGQRQMCRMDRYGFPRTRPKSVRSVYGFRTGDLVRAVVHHGVTAGAHIGRVAVRATGRFNITTSVGVVQGISYRHCRIVQACDGYRYATGGGGASSVA